MTTTRKRAYSLEDFAEHINARLHQLESQQEARQRYGGLLVVLRQQIDSYRKSRPAGK